MKSLKDTDFRQMLEEAVGDKCPLLIESLANTSTSVSIRLNPFKIQKYCKNNKDTREFVRKHFNDRAIEQVAWNENSYFLSQRPRFTLDPLFHAGVYYVQDSSAMFPTYIFREILENYLPHYHEDKEDNSKTAKNISPKGGNNKILKVLDLCASPGGKTLDLLTSLRKICGENFILVANEAVKQRIPSLVDNVTQWGEPNVIVTNVDPAVIGNNIPDFFDIILADVPCSGEGMFRKDSKAIAEWSKENVMLCQARQRRIVADIWPALKKDGFFIYSTCTFNSLENDDNVLWITQTLGADILSLEKEFDNVFFSGLGYNLLPGFVKGEGQYCSFLKNKGENKAGNNDNTKFMKHGPLNYKLLSNKNLQTQISQMFSSSTIALENIKNKKDCILIPENLYKLHELLSCLRPLKKGIPFTLIESEKILPNADLVLSNNFSKNFYPTVNVTLHEALAFLHKDKFDLSLKEKGYYTLSYKGFIIGLIKNLGNRFNNLHPTSKRIRMDIENIC